MEDMNNNQAHGKVAVLLGGTAAEREVSLKSGAAVLAALLRRGVDAHPVDAAEQPLQQLQDGGFERVFIALHGRGGEDGVIQGALETLGLPYTGSGVLGSALGMDKVRSKAVWRGLGLPIAAHRLLTGDESADEVIAELGLPLIVKPSREGSSLGMSRVEDSAQLTAAYRDAAVLDTEVFAEAWLPGAEYTVAILAGRALPAIRLEVPGGFYDYQAKYVGEDTRYLLPCGLDAEAEAEMANLARQAFTALGGEGWGRVDLRCDQQGTARLLEINTVPGMTDHSLVPMAAQAAGMEFEDLVMAILETSRR
jgi:D-alanine-D-alanine ligase